MDSLDIYIRNYVDTDLAEEREDVEDQAPIDLVGGLFGTFPDEPLTEIQNEILEAWIFYYYWLEENKPNLVEDKPIDTQMQSYIGFARRGIWPPVRPPKEEFDLQAEPDIPLSSSESPETNTEREMI